MCYLKCIFKLYFTFIPFLSLFLEHFSRALFATVSTSALTVSGICIFATWGLNPLVEDTLHGNYFLVNLLLTVLSTLLSGVLVVVAFRARKLVSTQPNAVST